MKIALQKEKSKRMMQLLSKKQSSMATILREEQQSPMEESINKTSSPFLQPKQVDLGINLDKDYNLKNYGNITN